MHVSYSSRPIHSRSGSTNLSILTYRAEGDASDTKSPRFLAYSQSVILNGATVARNRSVKNNAYLAEDDKACNTFSGPNRAHVRRAKQNPAQRIFILDTERTKHPERSHFI